MTAGIKANADGSAAIQVGGSDAITITSGLVVSMNGGTPYPLVSGTSVSASGTSVNFTDLPSWVKRVTVMFSGVGTNGSSNVQIQIGAGSVTTTGYSGGISQAGASPNQITLTTGLGITASNASALSSTGTAVFSSFGSNIWVGTSTTSRSDGYGQLGGTVVTLSGTLDRIRITTVNGTDTFDAGTINILYE